MITGILCVDLKNKSEPEQIRYFSDSIAHRSVVELMHYAIATAPFVLQAIFK